MCSAECHVMLQFYETNESVRKKVKYCTLRAPKESITCDNIKDSKQRKTKNTRKQLRKRGVIIF